MEVNVNRNQQEKMTMGIHWQLLYSLSPKTGQFTFYSCNTVFFMKIIFMHSYKTEIWYKQIHVSDT